MKLHLPVRLFRAIIALMVSVPSVLYAAYTPPSSIKVPDALSDNQVVVDSASDISAYCKRDEDVAFLLTDDLEIKSLTSQYMTSSAGTWFVTSDSKDALASITFSNSTTTTSAPSFFSVSSDESLTFAYLDTVLFDTITITSNSNGSAVVSGKNITFRDNKSVQFSGNKGASFGGNVISSSGGLLAFQNNAEVIFDSNKPYRASSVIYTSSDTIFTGNDLVKITNNTGYYSGGIYVGAATLTISENTDVLFQDNEAIWDGYSGGEGGAIKLSSSEAALAIEYNTGKVQFVSNEAFSGGAIWANEGTTVNLHNNEYLEFSSNVANKKSGGGAIYSKAGTKITENEKVVFIGNVSTTTESAGTPLYGGAILSQGLVHIQNNTDVLFDENNVKSSHSSLDTLNINGGAIGITNSSSIILEDNTKIVFSNNYVGTEAIPGVSSGGALYTGGEIVIKSNGEVEFNNNRTYSEAYSYFDNSGSVWEHKWVDHFYGGAIKANRVTINANKDKVSFNGNHTIGFNGTGSNGGEAAYTYGGAIYASIINVKENKSEVSFNNNYSQAVIANGGALCGTDISFSDNSDVVFEGNYAKGFGELAGGYKYRQAFGGAVKATNVSFIGNGDVDFLNNSAITIPFKSGSEYGKKSLGGAIYAANITIQNNGNVTFKGNNTLYNTTQTSDSIYQHDATGKLILSSRQGKTIAFYDAFYAAGEVLLNSKCEELAQTGDIRLITQTATTGGMTHLYDGRLRIEYEGDYSGKGMVIHSSVSGESAPTVWLKHGKLTHSDSNIQFQVGSCLELSGMNKITASSLEMQLGSALTFHVVADQMGVSNLALNGTFAQEGALTLNISFNDETAEAGLYKLMTVTSITDETLWTSSNVTVNGLDGFVVSFDDLEWKDNTLYLNYNGTPGTGGATTPTLLIATWTNEAGDGLWNGTSLNWEQEEVDYAYKDGVQVVFGDEGAGTVTLVGDIAPSSVLVDSVEDYIWNADSTAGGKLTGSMSLTKKGTGTLSLNTENDYTGGTTIQGGTVVAGTATALGIGTVSLTDATLKIAAEGVENALTTAGTSSILVQDGSSLALQSAITNAATGILTLSGKVDVSGIGELTKLEATRIDVNGNAGESGFARAEGYTLQVVNGGKVLASDAQLEHSGLPTGLTLVLGENGLATAGAATDFTKYVIGGSHAVSVSEILKDVPQDSALSSIEMSGGTLLVDAATDALAATGGTVTLSRDVKLGGTMSGGMLMAQAGEIAATLSGNTAVVVSGAVTLSGSNTHSGGVMLDGGVLTLKHAQALGSGPLVTSGTSSLFIDSGVELALGQAISNSGSLSISGSVTFSGNTATSSSSFAWGGAIGGPFSSSISLNNNGSVAFIGNTASSSGSSGSGGAISGDNIELSNNGSVTFSGNTASGFSAYGGAIYGDNIELSNNGSVTFSGNTAMGTPTEGGVWSCRGGAICFSTELIITGNALGVNKDGSAQQLLFEHNHATDCSASALVAAEVHGGAINGSGIHAALKINNNGESVFRGNYVHGKYSADGGAIYKRDGIFSIQNNASVVFEKNYTLQEETLRLQSIYAFDSYDSGQEMLVNFSAPKGGKIEFRDSIHIDVDSNSASAFHLNNWYINDDEEKVAQTGDIIFTGEDATAENLKAILAEHDIHREASADEIRLSKTSEVQGTMQLHDGRLIARDGAIIAVDGITVHGSASGLSTPTLWLDNGELRPHLNFQQNAIWISGGSALHLSRQNTARYSTLTLSAGSTLIIDVAAAHTTTAALTLNYSTLSLGGTITLQLNAAEGLNTAGRYMLLSGVSAPTDWASHITVSGGVWTIDALSWVGDTLYLNYPTLTEATWNNASGDWVWNVDSSVNWEQHELNWAYRNGIGVIFGDEACGTVKLAGNLAPKSVLVNNSIGKDYVFSGTGSLTDSMKLTKEGTGKLTIQTANSYTGGTEIKGGVLVVDNTKALGTGEVVLNGGTLEIAVTGLANTLANTGTSTLKVSNGKTHSLAGTIDNSGELTLEGLFDATALATAIGETHIDANGQEGNSGFLKTAGMEVDIITGSGTLVNNGTVSISGTTVTLDDKGYGKTGAEVQLGTYTIVDGTHSVEAILDRYSLADIILNAGGTLTADASTDALTTTGGVINMNEAIELGGSISGTELNISAGKLTAVLSGENTLNATGWQMDHTITNNGTLTLTGTVDATALATAIAQTYVDANGQEGNSGFLKTAGMEVDIMSGSGTLVNNGTVSIDGTTVVLDNSGYGKIGAAIQYDTYTIVDGTHSVEAIQGKSATADIILNAGGTLTADASTDALTTTGGVINMNEAIELGGSISGTELNISAGKLTAVLSGENTLNATGWQMDHTITNNGTLTLTGTVDATALATVIAQTHIDANGQEGNSGFLKTAGKEVDIMTGSGTLVNNGTVSIDGTTVVLDNSGYGKIGAAIQYDTYTIVDGTHSVAAILDKSSSADIILNAGGTLTADASTDALTTTGGVINMNEAIELGGSISGAVLNVSAGKLTATLEDENTLNATGWQMDHTITNNGTLTLTGTVDATALATVIAQTHIDANGQEGNSGFLKTAGKEVDIMTGSGTLVNNGTISIGGTTVTLDAGGYGKTGAEVQLGTYTIVDGTHSVEAILDKSATANIILEAGTLTADASTDALTATGGTINMDEAVELGGSISGTELNISAGKLTATLEDENTLNATGWQMDHTITNNGTLTLTGTVDATALATVIAQTHIDANGQEGNSGFLKTAGMEVDIITGSGTLVNNGTISIGGTTVTLDAGGYGKTGAELQLGTYTIVDGTHSVEAILGKSATADIILNAGGTLTADSSTDALTTTGGVINMNEAIELGGSISGTELNISAGKLTAVLSGENTLNATGWNISQAVTNNGTLTLTGTVDATALATVIGETHIDANGQEGNSGFLKTAGMEVDIMTGSGTLVNNGTVSIDGTTVVLDNSGYGKIGAAIQYDTYTIVDGTHSVAAILGKSATADIILNAGGTLTADSSTDALTTTGGVINMNEAIELGGSISGAVLNVSAGKLTATLEDENTLNATGWQTDHTITNNGTLTLTGTVDATALATVIAQTYVDANGQEGNSGFLKTAGKEVDIMTGSGTLVNNGTVSIDGTTVVLDNSGYGKIGAAIQYDTYTIVDGTHSVEAILGKSATADIILNAGGTLTADSSTDALTTTGGVINMNEAIELGGSISGTELNISAGKLTAVLSGENTLNATGWNISQAVTNNGTLTLTGTVDATALATVIAQTHIDANGQEGNSGFLKTAGMEVDIMSGSGTLVNNGTVSIDGTTVVLDSTGYGKTGAEVQLGTYTIVDGTHSVEAILDRYSSADIILNAGGTLTADASTDALTTTGGVINMNEAIELGGSISGTELNISAGKLTAVLSGENTLNATGWLLNQTITNNGTLTLTGTVDATALATVIAQTHIDANGQEGNSGFLKTAGKEVDIMTGSGTLVNNGTVSIDGTTVVLDNSGYGKIGAAIQYDSYTIVDGTHSVAAILGKSATADIILNAGGTLTADASTDALTTTGGVINMNEAIELGGSISGTELNISAGKLTATLEDENTLNATGWNISQAVTNNGTLNLTGTVDATALATVIAQTYVDANGQEGNSGFLKTAGKEVDIMSGSGTLVNNGTVSIDGTTVVLDSTGYGKTGAEVQLGTYTIVDGTHSVEAILDRYSSADIILNAGGTLTADASTDALTTTGGVINMNDAIELGGSISGAVLNVSAGKLTATLDDANTLNATGWQMSQTITNNGTLTLTGTVDATALATVIAQTHIDANGQEGNSGFLKTAGKEVDIMTGSGTLVNNGTVSIDGTTVVLDSTGYGKTGAELQLGTYTIVDGTHSVEAILGKSATANIILEAGTLTADASTDVLTATGGSIEITEAATLGGSIENTAVSTASGSYNAEISAMLKGGTTLEINGGEIIVSGDNSYTGGTTLNNGTVVAETATALGTGGVVLNGGTLEIGAAGLDNSISNSGTSRLQTSAGITHVLTGTISNTGTLTLSGSFEASALEYKTETSDQRYALDGSVVSSTQSGFSMGEKYAVQIVNGGLTNGAGATITHTSHQGSNPLVLGEDGWARANGDGSYSVFYLEGTDSLAVSTIAGVSSQHQETLSKVIMDSGSLTVDQSIAVDADGGSIVITKSSDLSGTIDDTAVSTGAGDYIGAISAVMGGSSSLAVGGGNITVSGANSYTGGTEIDNSRLTITHANALGTGGIVTKGNSSLVVNGVTLKLQGTIDNTAGGELSLKGALDASALAYTYQSDTRVSLDGLEVEKTKSGFGKDGQYQVVIVIGGTTKNEGVMVQHDNHRLRIPLMLGADGVAYASMAGVDYSRYHLTGDDRIVVSEIADVSYRESGMELVYVDMDGGELEVDQSIAVNATGGSISITDDAVLSGSIEDTAVTTAVGDYSSEISALLKGDTTLEVNGGSITVSGDNSYSGGTVVNGGILLAGHNKAFGAGDVTVNSATLDLNSFNIANKVRLNGNSTLGHADGASHIVLGGGSKVNFRDGFTLSSGKVLDVAAGGATYTGALTLGGGTIELDGKLTVQGDVVFESGKQTTIDISGWTSAGDGEVLVDFGSNSSGYTNDSLALSGIAGDWELKFDSATGNLVLAAVRDDFSPNLDRNQQAVYDTVKDIMTDGNPGGVLGLLGQEVAGSRDEAALKRVLDELSGREYATIMSSQMEGNMGHLRRLRAAAGAGTPLGEYVSVSYCYPSNKGVDKSDNKGASVQIAPSPVVDSRRLRAGISVFHEEGELDSDINGDGYDRSETGAQLTMEYMVSNEFIMGMGISQSRTRLTPDYGKRRHEDNTHFDLYGVYQSGRWSTTTALGVGLHQHDLGRTVAGMQTEAEADGFSVNFLQEVAYTVWADEQQGVQVYGAVESSFNQVDSFTETGAGNASLTMDSQEAWATDVTLGLRYNHALPALDKALPGTLSLYAGVVASLGDVEETSTMRFAGAPGYSFRQGAAERNRWGYSVGVSVNLPVSANVAAFGSAEAVLRGDSYTADAQLGLKVAF